MAALLRSESRNLYSWWWDSHHSPKNSKWLQDNLRDTDAKVKSMIKLIEEDADSFARRAEMYYKKRPELMKLVEEFYRAYRALAERYDHAVGELRQAQKTIAAAFPNEAPFMLADDAPSSSDKHAPVSPVPVRALFDAEDGDAGVGKNGLKRLNEMLQSAGEVSQTEKSAEERLKEAEEELEKARALAAQLAQLSSENENLKSRVANESDRAGKAETELQNTKEALAKTEVERDAALLQYQRSCEKLSRLEKALSHSLKEATECDLQTSKARSEIKELKDALVRLEVEKDAALRQYRESLDQVVMLETKISATYGDTRELNNRALKAETKSKILEEELSRSEEEKEANRVLYEQCLDKISALKNEISLAEENARSLTEQNARSKSEAEALKEDILRLKQEVEAAALRYEHCLQKISLLQKELTEAQDEAKRLNGEILLGSAKLRGAEEQCAVLGKVNQSLQLEANDLAQKIAVKSQELSQKEAEFEKLQRSLQDERSQFIQVEATLQALQNLHTRSQEEHRALAIELRNGLQMLKDLEMGKCNMEAEIQQLREENKSLNDLTLSSTVTEQNLRDEITSLKTMKEKLEGEVDRQSEKTVTLEQQVHQLKEEMGNLCRKYHDLIQQVEYSGLEPTRLGSSIKALQEENSVLRGSCDEYRAEKEVLLKELEQLEKILKHKSILESSLSDVSVELERSKEKIKMLQDSHLVLTGEKSTLVAEKASLLSQLQIMAESMQKILEQNAALENSLTDANSELEGLRDKSKSLEEFCQLFSNERSRLLDERSILISRLETVELKLENLERKFTWLEDKYVGLEKEKQSTLNQVQELRISIGIEKQERACLMMTSEARFSGMEDHIHYLQEENRSRKKDFEEQLDRAVKAQVEVFILQKFMQDIEERNCSLLIECHKHVEEAKHAERLIAELEGENMMYQLEAERLMEKIANLSTGIFQVLKLLEINQTTEAETEQNFMPLILSHVKEIKNHLSRCNDENHRLVIENYVLTSLLRHLNLEYTEIASQYAQELLLLTRQHAMLEKEKGVLLERNRCLELEVTERVNGEELLKHEMGKLQMELGVVQLAYAALEEEQWKELEGNQVLLKEVSDLEEEKHDMEEVINEVSLDAMDFCIQAAVLKSWGIEKALELEFVSRERDHSCIAYKNLQSRATELAANLEMRGLENLHLIESVQKLEEKQCELNCQNNELNQQVLVQQELLEKKESELSEMRGELKSTRDMNAELIRTVKVVEKDHDDLKAAGDILGERMLKLSEHSMQQDEEIKGLREASQRLEVEVRLLNEEIEECKIREEILSLELQDRNSEFELWEAEAASFYFDLQISGIKEVLFQNKVQELSGTCEDLETVSSRKSMEIELMKEKVKALEGEVEALRTQLAAYIPVIAALKANIASLEQNAALDRSLHLDGRVQEQVTDGRNLSDFKDQNFAPNDGLLELQKLQNRIKMVEKVLVEESERIARQERMKESAELQVPMREIADMSSRISAHSVVHMREEGLGNGYPVNGYLQSPESRRETGPETSESRTGTELKDIQLDLTSDCSSDGNSRRQNGQTEDRMLQLWEAVEKEYARDLKIGKGQHQTCLSEGDDMLYHEFEIGEQNSLNPTSEFQLVKELGVDKQELSRNVGYDNQEGSMKNILERLAGNANKLMSLQYAVQELRTKMEMNRRSSKDGEYVRLRDQMVEVENSVIQLVDTNTELMKSMEDRPSTSDTMALIELNEDEKILRKRVWKQAQRGSEKIGRLQLEVQKIQFVLLKLDSEGKRTGRSRLSRIRTGILLKDFLYRHRRSRRPKKSPFCGCFGVPAKEN